MYMHLYVYICCICTRICMYLFTVCKYLCMHMYAYIYLQTTCKESDSEILRETDKYINVLMDTIYEYVKK